MIDFHTHILPSIDDGAAGREEALALIEALIKEGVEVAVCTPHFDASLTSMQDFVMQRSRAMQELGQVKLRLVAASESSLHDYLFHYTDLGPLCIANTNYLLLELPFSARWDDRLYSMLGDLISYYNIIPIIAHIERYPAARGSGCANKLRDAGCLLQLNTSSLFDAEYRKKALKYIKKGYIDLLGSDCHDISRRPPVIRKALSLLEDKAGADLIGSITENGINVLKNIDIRR